MATATIHLFSKLITSSREAVVSHHHPVIMLVARRGCHLEALGEKRDRRLGRTCDCSESRYLCLHVPSFGKTVKARKALTCINCQ